MIIEIDWTHSLRIKELEKIKNLLAGKRILEIGSGDGFVASYLSGELNCKVIATDPKPRAPQYYKVEKIEQNADYRNYIEKYDPEVILSLHVLEHVNDLNALIQVLEKAESAIMIALVPSRFAYILTAILQPISYIRGFIYIFDGTYLTQARNSETTLSRMIVRRLQPLKCLIPDRHGRDNIFLAVKTWSKDYRRKQLLRYYKDVRIVSSDQVYSFHKLFREKVVRPRLVLKTRLPSSYFIICKK
jgi:SAM-dependent methyltransferase